MLFRSVASSMELDSLSLWSTTLASAGSGLFELDESGSSLAFAAALRSRHSRIWTLAVRSTANNKSASDSRSATIVLTQQNLNHNRPGIALTSGREICRLPDEVGSLQSLAIVLESGNIYLPLPARHTRNRYPQQREEPFSRYRSHRSH